jgi:hypothetical protein
MFTEPSLEPVEAEMAQMDLPERPALAVRLGEQEDIKASQDQTLMARIHDLEVKAAERDETIMYLMQQLRETENLEGGDA